MIIISFILLFHVFCFSGKTMGMTFKKDSIPSVADYFPELNGDLTKCTWAHAVNNRSLLQNAIENSTIMMLEADVVLGKLIGHNEIIPIMAHPPATESDLSLEDFIGEILQIQGSKRKGIKLDFKSTDVFIKSWEVIDHFSNRLNFPVWLNADILSGPVNSDGVPVDADTFLKLSAEKFPTTTLSVGWTTKYGPGISGTYTQDQLDNMKSVLLKHQIKQPVTFAVRAGIVAQSKADVITLVEQINEFQNLNSTTLTIWMSSDNDPVDVPKLKDLILTLTKSNVYLDVPDFLRNELNLDKNVVKSPITAAQGALVAFLTSVSAVFSNVLKLFE